MKKIILSALCIFLCLSAGAQAKIQTKKYKIADIPDKTMKVVLTGQEVLDAHIKEELQNIWNISPYEFCTYTEFDALKSNTDYYFLILTDSQFRGDRQAGIRMFSLFKGTEKASDNVKGLYEVISIPFCSAGESNGKEYDFLPMILRCFQTQVEKMMSQEFIVTSMVEAKVDRALGKWSERVMMTEEDVAFELNNSMKAIYRHENIDIVPANELEDVMDGKKSGYLVAYTVNPPEGVKGSVCFKMLFNAETSELYYISKHSVSVKNPAGFTKSDMTKIIKHKNNK